MKCMQSSGNTSGSCGRGGVSAARGRRGGGAAEGDTHELDARQRVLGVGGGVARGAHGALRGPRADGRRGAPVVRGVAGAPPHERPVAVGAARHPHPAAVGERAREARDARVPEPRELQLAPVAVPAQRPTQSGDAEGSGRPGGAYL